MLQAAGDRVTRADNLLRNRLHETGRDELEAALNLLQNFDEAGSDPRIEREIRVLAARLATLDESIPTERADIDDLAGLEIRTPPGDAIRERVEDATPIGSQLPIVLNDRVLSMVEYFSDGRGRPTMAAGLDRAGRYRPMIEAIFDEVGIPRELIHLAQAESGFRPTAVSSARARGMWQFIAARGSEYGLRQNWWMDERSDPVKSTRAAAEHLKDLYDDFGDWYLAMAAYNSGPGRVRTAIERAGSNDFWVLSERRLLPQETRNYVPTILAMTIIGKDPERYGFEPNPDDPLVVDRVGVTLATDLRVISEQLDIPIAEIQAMNPQLLRWATPPDVQDFQLNLPSGRAPDFEARVAPLRANERILFARHVVGSGETVSHLAVRYGVDISAISDANNLPANHTIRVGQSLMIPISGVTAGGALAASGSGSTPEVYAIRRGDTLSGIADRYGVTVDQIRVWNNMNSDLLIAGETLRLSVPGAGGSGAGGPILYSVRPGDTLWGIASSYRTSVDQIRAWNTEADLSILRPGDRIQLYLQE